MLEKTKSIVFATLLFYNQYGIKALLYAFLISGILQCIQITWSARNIWRLKPIALNEKKSVKKLFTLALPLLAGNALYEINDIVDKRIAAGLSEGSVSYLSFGASINEIVTSIVVTSFTTVLFSHYATWISQNERRRVSDKLIESLDYLLVLLMPVMIMCFIAGDTIVSILYGRGNFGHDEVINTNSVVLGYAAGFFFQAARANIIKVYYAFQNTKLPMINGTISVLVNITLSITLSKYLGVSGVALATSISMLLVTVLLIPGIKKYLPEFSIFVLAPDIIKVITAGAITFITAFLFRNYLNCGVFYQFLIIGSYITLSYSMLLYVLKVKCIHDIINKLKTIIRQNKRDNSGA